MPLHIHRAERADTLVEVLAAQLGVPLADPFAAEVVAVQAKGVQRWLTQRLSTMLGAADGADGIAANIEFPSPAALVADALAAADARAPEQDPWDSARAVWTMLRVLDDAVGQPWAGVLARHLGALGANGHGENEHRIGRRYATAAHLIALFESYATQRPALITAWADGANTDGAGGAIPEDLAWQPLLWRGLRAAIGTASPAERLTAACTRLRADPGLVALPPRLSLFGVTRLTVDQRAVLSALAEHREIHLWFTHPSPVLWRALAAAAGAGSRSEDTTAALVRHPLLGALGRDVRELQRGLAGLAATDTYHPVTEADTAKPSAANAETLLAAVHAGIRDDHWPPEGGRSADGSIQLHACHGAARQVEVLRDCLLGLFAADETLQPRDVVIMCPEVETYAPLVRAAFGQRGTEPVDQATTARHPAQLLRVRLADRGRAVTNPLLAVIGVLLDLADGRVTVTQVLDLAAAEPIRRRCGFDDDDIERLREWAAESGARWGIGQRQRQAFGLADFAQNTLNTAVDRILLGVTAGETDDDWLALALPLADVDSNDVDLAGRFAEFIDRLAVCLRDLRGPRPAHEWATVLARALDLLTDVPRAQEWVRTEARRELATATEHADAVDLRLPDIEVLLRSRLAASPARANFRTGELTVCGLAPMRAVGHRVVVLLGLDDEVFPRAGGVDGDDVLARDPQAGERDPRSEDRQLLLEAVLAASDRLLVFYSGADPVMGTPRPPAVPVAELLDVLRAQVDPAQMDRVLTRHPLQDFDARNFSGARPFSFDTVALEGARAAQQPAVVRAAFLSEPLPPMSQQDVALAELISFVEHPLRAFLWQRLGLRIPEHDDDIADRLPIELDGLAKWELGERLLTARLTGADPAALRAAEWRRGTLPPFGFGAAVLDEVEHTVDRLVRVSKDDYTGTARAVDIAVDLGNGRRLAGTVPEVRGETLVRTTFSRLAPKHRISAWVSVLALAVTEDRSWRAVGTGRGQFGRPAWRSELTAPEPPAALAILRELVALRDAGMVEPLPIAPTASAAYAERRFRGGSVEDAVTAAEREFNGGPNGPGAFGDHTDRHLRFVFGSAPRLDDLMRAPAQAGEPGETTRFGALARRLWAPMLAAENQGQP
ncbi:exodeoxyribonuclease V subunit gamma [Nocardia callitridis]|uniref:RecBCD enzyme subunit RecC n=1 Tax=Nocardia callitridis TaxID=648753 RepID=A0ABP9KA68_9NOCA